MPFAPGLARTRPSMRGPSAFNYLAVILAIASPAFTPADPSGTASEMLAAQHKEVGPPPFHGTGIQEVGWGSYDVVYVGCGVEVDSPVELVGGVPSPPWRGGTHVNATWDWVYWCASLPPCLHQFRP